MLRTLYDQDNEAFGKYMEKAYETGDFYGKKLRGALKDLQEGLRQRNFSAGAIHS